MGCDHRHIGTQYLGHCIFTTLLVRTLETMGEKETMWEWGGTENKFNHSVCGWE